MHQSNRTPILDTWFTTPRLFHSFLLIDPESTCRMISTRIGKYRIQKVLRRCNAKVLSDFILPAAYGGLTRIDHAVLTPDGILSILTKHCNGVVLGEPVEAQWTLGTGARRRSFLNPLIQNEGRIKALKKIDPEVSVSGVVVFTGAVRLRSAPNQNVVHISDLEAYLADYLSDTPSIDQLTDVWESVKTAALTDDASRKDFHAQLSFS